MTRRSWTYFLSASWFGSGSNVEDVGAWTHVLGHLSQTVVIRDPAVAHGRSLYYRSDGLDYFLSLSWALMMQGAELPSGQVVLIVNRDELRMINNGLNETIEALDAEEVCCTCRSVARRRGSRSSESVPRNMWSTVASCVDA